MESPAVSHFKTTAFGIITFMIAVFFLESALRVLYYQLNEEDWAIQKAIVAAYDNVSTLLKESAPQSISTPLVMPADVLVSLKQIGGVVENANNPTGIERKRSPLTLLDPVVGYRLRPNVNIRQHMVYPTNPGNLDPPVVSYDIGSTLPENLKAWLKASTALSYDYTTDDSGRRVTLPSVSANEKVVIVGDSVAFGVGVNDSETMASQLQARLGKSRQVVNLGVGGYTAEQAYLTAMQSPDAKKGNILVYIACQNDFFQEKINFNIASMVEWMKKFAGLKQSGHYREVMIVLESYQEFSFHHFLKRWPDEAVQTMAKGFAVFDTLPAQFGFIGMNWNEMLKAFNVERKSLFASFALYADHAHLSPEGNRYLALEIYRLLPGAVSSGSDGMPQN